MTKRDREALSRLIDKYGVRSLAEEIGDYHSVQVTKMAVTDEIGRRWNARASKLLPVVIKTAMSSIDGRKESQPEIDNLLRVS